MSDNESNNESTKRKSEEDVNEKDSKKQSTEEVKSEKKTGIGYECKRFAFFLLILVDLDHTADIQFHACKGSILPIFIVI